MIFCPWQSGGINAGEKVRMEESHHATSLSPANLHFDRWIHVVKRSSGGRAPARTSREVADRLSSSTRRYKNNKKKAAKAKLREIKAIYTASARCSGDQLSADKQSFLQTETLGSQISLQQDDRLTRAGIRILTLFFFFYLPRLRCHKDTILSYSHLCSRGKVI